MDDSFGKAGESLAEKYLINKQYYILAKNYQSEFGGVDIIASDGSSIVFVEVKTRRQNQPGTTIDSITKGKLNNLVKSSQLYLSQRNLQGQRYRFDVIEVIMKQDEKPIINHLLNIVF